MCLPNTIQESSDEAVGYTPASHRALILLKKFLATCTTSVPPTSSFPANKAASYAVTRLQLLSAARNTAAFPVGAQHCCAPARHNVSDHALYLLSTLARRTTPVASSTYRLLESLASLFATPTLCFQ